VEVNLGSEPQKHGVAPDEVEGVVEAMERSTALRPAGLMTIPPFTEDPEGARPYFDELAKLRDRLGGAERLPELSMGMSHDLEPAIAAGATWVRLGTAVFGSRESQQP
jgi:hypothetical protein